METADKFAESDIRDTLEAKRMLGESEYELTGQSTAWRALWQRLLSGGHDGRIEKSLTENGGLGIEQKSHTQGEN